MSEDSFKRRLALLEECPESERAIYTRQFSDFTKWCLVRIEEIFLQCDRSLEKTRRYLKEKGLETDQYFTQRSEMGTRFGYRQRDRECPQSPRSEGLAAN